MLKEQTLLKNLGMRDIAAVTPVAGTVSDAARVRETDSNTLITAIDDWERHDAGLVDALNISRRGMKSWARLDAISCGLYGFRVEIEDELWRRRVPPGDAYHRRMPGDIGRSAASELLPPVWAAVEPRGRKYWLLPDERAVALAYWRERLELVDRFGVFRWRKDDAFHRGVRKCGRQTQAVIDALNPAPPSGW